GNSINTATMPGCATDSDCAAGNWCNESIFTCASTLANGSPIPNDAPHVNPTLNGICTSPAAALVCASGVCDSNDSLCGYADGDGPCNGTAECRSGACSINGLCEPVGSCNVDGDCAVGNWCLEVVHTCTPAFPNGAPIPNDPPHVNPTLNGMCTSAA